MELDDALIIANDLVKELSPNCSLINIAGSCRREKEEVKDIEIVALPKYNQIQNIQGVLFDDIPAAVELIISPEYVEAYKNIGCVIKGRPNGKYSQFELRQGINLDLFTPNEFDYYRQFAMRTGSADYSARVIATGWKNIGWCGTDDGCRKITDCKKDKSNKWKCINKKAVLPPVWKSEEEFFDWIKVKWIEPHKRI